MLRTRPTLGIVFRLLEGIRFKAPPVLDKSYFSNRLREISKVLDNPDRRIYKCELRRELIDKYSKRESEVIDWLLTIIRNDRVSDVNYALEAMYALEQINPERAMKELKYYATVNCENNEKIKDTAERIVTCHIFQAIERDFTAVTNMNPLTSKARCEIVQRYVNEYGEELVTISLARLFLNACSSILIKQEALYFLREIKPDKVVETLISEMRRMNQKV